MVDSLVFFRSEPVRPFGKQCEWYTILIIESVYNEYLVLIAIKQVVNMTCLFFHIDIFCELKPMHCHIET